MKNLHIVSSPFQLISALEAINTFSKAENVIVIFYTYSHSNNKLLDKIINQNNIEVFFHYIHFKNSTQYLLAKIELLQKLKKNFYNNLFIGHVEEFSNKLFICNIKYRTLFALDDGAATINHNLLYVDRITHFKLFNANKVKDLFKLLIIKIFLLKTDINVTLNWFSVFDFEPTNKALLINHNFEYIKNKYSLVTKKDTNTYFIGSNLLNANIIKNENTYVTYLETLFKSFNYEKIYYIPHRLEDIDKIKGLLNKYSIELLSLDNTIELSFLENDIYPNNIISFYSTALFTLSKLFSETTINFIALPSEILNENFTSKVETVQKYYESKFYHYKISE